jgi:hypothetical protein
LSAQAVQCLLVTAAQQPGRTAISQSAPHREVTAPHHGGNPAQCCRVRSGQKPPPTCSSADIREIIAPDSAEAASWPSWAATRRALRACTAMAGTKSVLTPGPRDKPALRRSHRARENRGRNKISSIRVSTVRREPRHGADHGEPEEMRKILLDALGREHGDGAGCISDGTILLLRGGEHRGGRHADAQKTH